MESGSCPSVESEVVEVTPPEPAETEPAVETATIVTPPADVAPDVVETIPPADTVTETPEVAVLDTVIERPPPVVASQVVVGPPAPAPTVTATQQIGPQPPPVPPPAPAGNLARTGASTQLLVLAAAAALLTGRWMLALGRRLEHADPARP